MRDPLFQPQAHSKVEMTIMRALFALVAFDVIPPHSVPRVELSKPVGLAALGLDLSFLSDPRVFAVLQWGSYALLILYVLRIGPLLTISALAVMTILTGTYVNSTGDIKHHHQIVSLILLAQALWHAWWSLRHRGAPQALERERWAMFAAQQAIVAAYVVTGLTKINTSGVFGWIRESANYPIQVRKTNLQAYYNTLEPASAAGGGLEAFFGNHPQAGAALLAGGLLLELGTIVALLGRKWSLLWGLLLMAFHWLNSVFMNLNFRWHVEVVAIFLVLPPLIALISHWSEQRTRATRHAVT